MVHFCTVAGCIGVAACVAFALLVAHKTPDSLLRGLEAHPFFVFVLIVLAAMGNACQRDRSKQGLERLQMRLGSTLSRPPLSLRAKLFCLTCLYWNISLMVFVNILKH